MLTRGDAVGRSGATGAWTDESAGTCPHCLAAAKRDLFGRTSECCGGGGGGA